MNQPKTFDDLYPSYLYAEHLPEEGAEVTIERVYFAEFPKNPHKQGGAMETCAVLTFKGARRHLILNQQKTQELAIAAATTTYNDLPGRKVTLLPVQGRGGQERVGLEPAGEPTRPKPMKIEPGQTRIANKSPQTNGRRLQPFK